jgi:hypothetical protein
MPDIEIIGVRASWWAKDTGQPVISVIVPAARCAIEADPYDFARYLSSGYDTGASAFSSDTGGGTAVRDTTTGNILARYSDGAPATLEHMPFREGAA